MSFTILTAFETAEQKAEYDFMLRVKKFFGISKKEYDLLKVIFHYTLYDEWCFLPLKDVAKEVGVSRATLYKLLPHLIELGLLKKNSYRSEILKTTHKYYNDITTLKINSAAEAYKQTSQPQ